MADKRLVRLLNPGSVVFVGGARARLAVEQTTKFGYTGDIWWVHPESEFKTLDDLPGVPDAVFVGVAAEQAIEVVGQAERIGVAGAVVYAAEFAETGPDGADRQGRLVAAAAGMPMIGPNCHGFVNARSGAVLWPDIHGCARVDSGVAIVTQSGNVGIDLTMQQRGLPIATVITAGNQANVTITDLLEALIDDPTITAVGLHIEGLVDSVRFGRAALRARAVGKPIVVLKTGTSVKGSAIANTHTASLSGPADAHRALFKRYAITEAHTPEELLGALSYLHTNGQPPGKRLVSFSCSGGEAQLMADLSEGLDLEFPAFPPATRADLDRILEGRVAIENPLDYHTFIWGDAERLDDCFTTAIRSGVDIAILVIDFPAPGADADWWPTLDAFIAAVGKNDCAGVVTSTMTESLPRSVCEYLVERGVTPLPGMSTSLLTLSRLCRSTQTIGAVHHGPPQAGTTTILSEAAAKERLASWGLPVPTGYPTNRASAEGVAASLGYPIALKAQSVAHRSEVGGVALGLNDEKDLSRAVASMAQLGDDFLIERMVDSVIAELLVGIIDRPVGWTLTIGAGGVLTELIADVVTIVLPTSADEIRHALASLAINVMLVGYRSVPPGDIEAAVAAILLLSELAVAEHAEIEINPLLVCEEGVWIVDALMEVST